MQAGGQAGAALTRRHEGPGLVPRHPTSLDLQVLQVRWQALEPDPVDSLVDFFSHQLVAALVDARDLQPLQGRRVPAAVVMREGG